MSGIHSIKITDVNQFCLEKIFQYADLEDLLNVANASKCLQLATYSPYARQNATKSIEISLKYDRFGEKLVYYDSSNANIINAESKISIRDFKTALQMLRCFGHNFADISFNYSSTTRKVQRDYNIMRYINKYCANSLIKLKLNTGYALYAFGEPFPNVESLVLNGPSSSEYCNITRIFPNLRRLNLTIDQNNQGCIAPAHFSYLSHLQFRLYELKAYDYKNEIIFDFLRENSQLRSFAIESINFIFLKHMTRSADLRCIKSLYVALSACNHKGDFIRLPGVKNFVINFLGVTQAEFPFVLNKLKELSIKGDFDWLFSFDNFITFIKAHPKIEKIRLQSIKLLSTKECSKLVNALPSLQCIIIIPKLRCENLTIAKINGYLAIFTRLKSVCFLIRDRDISEEAILTQCSEDWRVISDKQYMPEHTLYTFKPIQSIDGDCSSALCARKDDIYYAFYFDR